LEVKSQNKLGKINTINKINHKNNNQYTFINKIKKEPKTFAALQTQPFKSPVNTWGEWDNWALSEPLCALALPLRIRFSTMERARRLVPKVSSFSDV